MLNRTVSRRDALRITAVAGVSTVFGGGLAVGILRQAGLQRISETRSQMGTVVTITVVHPEAAAARQMVTASFAEMARIEGVLSRHRDDTPVARLNATGRLEGPPPELVTVLERANHYSRETNGAFDITIAPLLTLFEHSFDDLGRTPTEGDVTAARELVDYRALHVTDESIEFEDARMSVTLDGIAKGFVVDRTIDVLIAGGAKRVMVNAGGDIATGGPGSEAEPWTVGIQDPNDATDYVGLVRLGGECIATSGDYIGSFTEDRQFHHIIDPRTGRSPEELSSVSVVASTAMDADALSTAVLVLGPERGINLLENTEGVEGVVIRKDGALVRSSGIGRHAV
jgi:thiamine biosynthesis lipoprotein